MKLLISTFALSIMLLSVDTFAISDGDIAEITDRLENLSTDELVDRRKLLLAQVETLGEDEYEDGCENEIDDDKDGDIYGDDSDCTAAAALPVSSNSAKLLEISIIEQLLLLAGVVLIDNVTEDSTTPPDTVFPIITILGNNPAIVELGSIYTDAGATSDGGETVTSSGTVDTNTVGTYTITYSASDAAGNTSTATRTVNVVDTTAPEVTLTGATTVTVELGDTYTELGATATDASGTMTVEITGTVDTNTVGSYTVTYTSTDASGNVGTATRTVNVVDTTAPVITSSDTFIADENQTAIGTVTATDLQSVTFTVSGTELQITSSGVLTFIVAPDYETKSVYTATVTATDASSNSTTQDITVNVNDVGGIDDDPGTGTGTSTSTGTSTGTGTGTGT